MSSFYDALAPVLGVGAALALLVALVFVLLGSFRRYRIVAAYIAWELFATAALTIADVMLHGSAVGASGGGVKLYARLYWTNDVIEDLFRFVLVTVLIYRASDGPRRISPKLLAAVVLAVTILPFVLFHTNARPLQLGSLAIPFPSSAWFNSASEMLNFGAAIMNLMLWATLIASRKRDPLLLLVSAGLGVVVTGTAIAYGFRHLVGAGQLGALMSFFLNLTQMAGWTIWCWAFRPVKNRQPKLAAVDSAP